MQTCQVLILAGGKGTRLPQYEKKELIPINNKPIINHLLDNVELSGVCPKPAIVVGHNAEKIISVLGDRYFFIYQKEQLGTGHAVRCAKEFLEHNYCNVIILYGDHPFIKAETISLLNQKFVESKPTLALITVQLPDFKDWHSFFLNYGRIIRDQSGAIQSIVEAKDADEEQYKITEVNPGYYCFNAEWLWENIDKLSNNNKQKEYYLTDLVGMAFKQGRKIETIVCNNPIEGFGINTPEQLEIVQRYEEQF